MSDRIPGSSYDNPIWYKQKWRIYLSSEGLAPDYTYQHDDFDPTPLHLYDNGPADNRAGYADTVEECKTEIDGYEEDHSDG